MTCLSPFFINKAKKELGEDENKKRQSLELFKKFLNTHPFIKMYEIDEVNLLMHLRRKKYYNEIALQSFEDMKVFEKSHPEFFEVSAKELDYFVDSSHGLIRMLKERSSDGSRVVLIDLRHGNGSELTVSDLLRYFQNFFTAFLYEEETQIAGINLIYDCSGVTFSYTKRKFSPIVLYRFFSQMKFFPIRIKQINVVGMPSYGVVVFELIHNFFSKKLKSRLNVLKNIKDLHTVMDTSKLLLDDQSDYNEDNFVAIPDKIRRAIKQYSSYEVDFNQLKNSKKRKNQKTLIIDELGFD